MAITGLGNWLYLFPIQSETKLYGSKKTSTNKEAMSAKDLSEQKTILQFSRFHSICKIQQILEDHKNFPNFCQSDYNTTICKAVPCCVGDW